MEVGVISSVYIVAEVLEGDAFDFISFSASLAEARTSKTSLEETGYSNLIIAKQTLEMIE